MREDADIGDEMGIGVICWSWIGCQSLIYLCCERCKPLFSHVALTPKKNEEGEDLLEQKTNADHV